MRILIPWYRFPPFSEETIGGLSVSVYELSLNLSNVGHDVEVMVPPSLDGERQESFGNIVVTRDDLGQRLAGNEDLNSKLKFFDNYDVILSIDNFAGKSLKPLLKNKRVARQIHTVAPDRPVSSYLSLKANLTEYAKMYVLRRREIEKEKELKGSSSICVSRFLLRKMIEYGLESDSNLTHVPNGIDTHLFR
ncbi:MAG: glycosyltransferase, partial [Nitrososphaerales archaeon]